MLIAPAALRAAGIMVGKIAAGYDHILYVSGDGTLYAVGDNSNGQLGDGTNTSHDTPVRVAANVNAVAAGGSHSLYVTNDGQLYAMGNNDSGQLGIGDMVNRNTPVQVPGANNVVAVAAGASHSLYVTSDGRLYAMGAGGTGSLGVGDTANHNTPVLVASNVIAVAAGDGHSLYITKDGRLLAMGYNRYGQLGVGDTTNRNIPVLVASNVVAVAAGASHSLFVTKDGKLYTMGANDCGQLGIGSYDFDAHVTPTQVSGSSNVVAVAAGPSHSLYVTSDGTLWGMGSALTGALGSYFGNQKQSTPVKLASHVIAVAAAYNFSIYVTNDDKLYRLGDGVGGSHQPTVIANDIIALVAPAITTQPSHQIVIPGKDAVFTVETTGYPVPILKWQFSANGSTWADISDANVITNTVTDITARNTTTLTITNVTASMTGMQFRCVATNSQGSSASDAATLVITFKIAAGASHSLYVTGDGRLWAMGGNNYGQLGLGDTTSRKTPVQVPGANNVVDASASPNSFTPHSLYVASDGKLYAMGYNGAGDLGDGSTINRIRPVQVPAAGYVIAEAAGDSHSLYATSDGNLWAMGGNSSGQLGVSNTTRSINPVKVTMQSSAIAVAAGGQHSLYITSDGQLWGMGSNLTGQLDGNGIGYSNSTPGRVSTANNVVAATAGNDFSLYVTSDGQLWAMGNNSYGQLGDIDNTGTISDTFGNPIYYCNNPTQVPGASNIVAVSAGFGHTLYATNDGKLWAMGRNDYGQLGVGDTINRGMPVQVPGASNVVAVAAGFDYSLYMTSDGMLWAMGNNSSGQLGLGDTASCVTPVEVLPRINVIFNSQDGIVSPDHKSVVPNQFYGDLPIPTRMGYFFDGWWTGAGGAGTQVTADTLVDGGATEHTLYAKWTSALTVTFDMQGGSLESGQPTSRTLIQGQSYGTLPTPIRNNYYFDGWWTNLNGTGTQVTADMIVPASTINCVLYAKWVNAVSPILLVTPSSYSLPNAEATFVSFRVVNNGLGTMPWVATVTTGGAWASIYGGASGTSAAGSANASFVSIICTDNPAGGESRTASIQITATNATNSPAIVTITQPANPITNVSVTLDPQGGAVLPTTITATQGQPYGTLPTPTLGGYDFGGWWTGANGAGTQITASSIVPANATNQTLYAKWTASTQPPQPPQPPPGAPSITVQATNQTATAGQNATFSVSVAGNPTPTYQWQVSSNGITWSNVYGATAATLTLNSVTTAMSDNQYRCIITNTQGSTVGNIATLTVTPGTATTININISTLKAGSPASGDGWTFDRPFSDNPDYYALTLDNSSYNYALTGSSALSVDVYVENAAALTLDNLTLSNGSLNVYSAILVQVKNRVTFGLDITSFAGNGSGHLTLDIATGAVLTVDGGYQGGDLIVQGAGTFNVGSTPTSSYAIDISNPDGDLMLQGSVTVNATAANYIAPGSNSNGPYTSYWYGPSGVFCDVLIIADHAKLIATGGDEFTGDGTCYIGYGISVSDVVVISDAPNALTATSGTSRTNVPVAYGNGITNLNSYARSSYGLTITGSGQIKATGNNGIYSLQDITLDGPTITAEGRGAGYALYASGTVTTWNPYNDTGGTVHITAGAITAFNRDTSANVYYKYLDKTGGTLNAALPPTTYALTVSNGTGSGNYAAGENVPITAAAAPSGKVFDRWTSSAGGTFTQANNSTTIFTMPANATTLTATYKDQATGGGGNTGGGNSGGGGGGGAPSLLYLAAALALFVLRAKRRT